MDIQQKANGSVIIFKPQIPNLDVKSAPEFKSNMVKLIHAQPSRQVVLDLGSIFFIDSSGLGSLISLLRVLQSEHGSLKLTNISKPIRTMFDLVSMDKIFESFSTAEEAIKAFEDKPKS